MDGHDVGDLGFTLFKVYVSGVQGTGQGHVLTMGVEWVQSTDPVQTPRCIHEHSFN